MMHFRGQDYDIFIAVVLSWQLEFYTCSITSKHFVFSQRLAKYLCTFNDELCICVLFLLNKLCILHNKNIYTVTVEGI